MHACGGIDWSRNAKVQILSSFLAILKKYVYHEAKLKFIGNLDFIAGEETRRRINP